MTTAIELKRQLRTQLMNWAYETAGGRQDELLHPELLTSRFLADDSELTESDLRAAIRYLEGERLIKAHWVMGGLPSFQLTHRGIVEVEQGISTPTRSTEHFVPLISILNVGGDVTGSQIMQGSPNASQGLVVENELHLARQFATTARSLLDASALDPRDRSKLDGDLRYMELEIDRPEPRFRALRGIAQAVREILVAGLGDEVASILNKVPWP